MVRRRLIRRLHFLDLSSAETRLIPKTILMASLWTESKVWISWAKTGTKIVISNKNCVLMFIVVTYVTSGHQVCNRKKLHQSHNTRRHTSHTTRVIFLTRNTFCGTCICPMLFTSHTVCQQRRIFSDVFPPTYSWDDHVASTLAAKILNLRCTEPQLLSISCNFGS